MFELDPRLEADTFLIGKTPLNRILLMNDCRYPWFILVPERPDITEPFDLNEEDQRTLWQESMTLGKVIRTVFEAQKLNIAALGNQVSQLHIHHVARSSADAAWPRPVWGVGVAEPYETTAARERIAAIQEAVSHHLTLEFPGS